MVVHLIFGRTAFVYGHGLDLLDVVMLIDLPAVVMPFKFHATVLQGLLISLEGPEVKGFLQGSLGIHIDFGVWISGSKHVINVKTQHPHKRWA